MEEIILPSLQYDKNNTYIKALEKEEISLLLETLKSGHVSLENYYLYCFALGAGLRREELLGLTWDNVDFQKEKFLL